MTFFQSLCMAIGAAVLFIIAAVIVILALSIIVIGVMEWRENHEQRELVRRRMEGKE